MDHKNRDTLDCRKENLRLANKSQNGGNAAKTRGSSRYKGVCWDNNKKAWRSYITVEGVRYELGYLQDEVEAARCYDCEARKRFREFARLNFPEAGEQPALLG